MTNKRTHAAGLGQIPPTETTFAPHLDILGCAVDPRRGLAALRAAAAVLAACGFSVADVVKGSNSRLAWAAGGPKPRGRMAEAGATFGLAEVAAADCLGIGFLGPKFELVLREHAVH